MFDTMSTRSHHVARTDMSRLVQEATADYTEEDDEQGTAQTLRPSFPHSDA